MFYEENVIKKLLNCNQCNQPFDRPLNTPCGKILCSNCVQNDTVRVNQFACKHCSLTHQIPTNGFPENHTILALMHEQPKEVCKSKEIEDLKSNLEELNKELTRFEFHIRNPEDNIKNHFTEQKRLVQLKTEETILEIQNLNEKLIQTLENNEKDCLESLKHVDSQTLNNYEKIIKPEIIKNQEKVNSLLNKGLLNESEVKLGKELVAKTKESIETESIKLNKLRYGDKFIEFKANDKKLNQFFLGELREKKEREPLVYSELFDDEAEEVENSDYDEDEDDYDEDEEGYDDEEEEEYDDEEEEEYEDEAEEDQEDFMDEDDNGEYEEEQDTHDNQDDYDQDFEDEDLEDDESEDDYEEEYYDEEEEDPDYNTGDELNEDDEQLYINENDDDEYEEDNEDDTHDDEEEEDSSNYNDDFEAEREHGQPISCLRVWTDEDEDEDEEEDVWEDANHLLY